MKGLRMQITVAKFRNDMADPVNRAAYGGERVILTRRNEGIAALVSMEDLRTLEALEEEADLKAALKARKEKGGVPLERIEARLAHR
jgi:prevent-host-death family protein